MKKILTIVPLLVLSVVACATRIDHSKVEQSIKDELKTKGVTMASVTCPDKITAKAGGTFDCTGTDDQGTNAKFTVTMKDDQGSIEWKLDGKIIDMKKLGDGMESKIAAAGKPIDVKCPEKSMIAKKGCQFACDATDGHDTVKIHFTCSDDEGNLDYKM